VLCVALCGCGKKETDKTSILTQMTSYVANAEVTYISDRGSITYSAKHYALQDGRYCIEISSPYENAGDKVLFDGKMIWHYSAVNKDKISVAMPDKAERQQIILFAFVKNMLSTHTANGDFKSDVYEAQMPKVHKYMNNERLWLNKETSLPEKLIIYDSDGKERVIVTFSDFKYNEEIDFEGLMQMIGING
jgi:outer membrane lipoprotein-sorting protein